MRTSTQTPSKVLKRQKRPLRFARLDRYGREIGPALIADRRQSVRIQNGKPAHTYT